MSVSVVAPPDLHLSIDGVCSYFLRPPISSWSATRVGGRSKPPIEGLRCPSHGETVVSFALIVSRQSESDPMLLARHLNPSGRAHAIVARMRLISANASFFSDGVISEAWIPL